jgi:hypothetical protein
LAADLVLWAFRGRRSSRIAWATTGGVLTGMYVVGYFATVGSTLVLTLPADWWPAGLGETAGIGYPAPVVVLAVILSAAIGLLIGFVSARSGPGGRFPDGG